MTDFPKNYIYRSMTNKDSRKGLVLLSGGQDSVTCLAIALNECETVEAVCFDYGQRHKVELDQAKKIAEIAEVPLRVVDLTFIQNLNRNALTDSTIKIEETDDLPSTFVPGRNLFFISTAAVIAREQGLKT